MNPEQITLVQNTFKHIQPIAETAAGLFIPQIKLKNQGPP